MRAFDWLFKNRQTGEITIAQFPNLPLWLFLGAALAQRVADDSSSLDTLANLAGSAALGWWAIGEVARGVNPWRRILGASGVVFVAYRLITAF